MTLKKGSEILTEAPMNAGIYTVEVHTEAGKNYEAGSQTFSFEIKKAPLSVKAVDRNVTVGDAIPEYTVLYEGFAGTDTADVLNIFRCFGEAEVIAEPMIHPVVGVSGSSPAYVFMFIEAMADAAVLGGMPRAQAYKFAAQAVMGSAKMVLETGEHPGALKDMVCSPGGTTIEAVRVLEEKGFRAAVIEAMTKCMEKSEKLSKS